MVGEVTKRLLAARGHTVHVASQPDEALALWGRHRRNIDLVLCDVAMAQMRGPELIARLKRDGSPPCVLFMSGYSSEAARAALSHPVVTKPFTATALWEGITEALSHDAHAESVRGKDFAC